MIRLRIPDEQRDGLQAIVGASIENIALVAGILTSEIEASEGKVDFQNFTLSVISKTQSIPSNKRMIEAIISLYIAKADLDAPLVEFVDALAKAVVECDGIEIEKGDDDRIPEIKQKFVQLLSIVRLSNAAKAADLQLENCNIFYESRILTDIRPIFGATVREPPVGAVITNSLKIRYFQNKKVNEIIFAIDSDDLSSLIEVLKRAQEKEEQLISVLRIAGLPFYAVK